MQFKFLSLNLWQGGNLFDDILVFLKQEDADVIALQEVYNGTDSSLDKNYRSLEIIARELRYPYHHFAPAWLDNRAEGKIEEGNAVFSKYPILSSEVVFYDVPYSHTYRELVENFSTCPRNLEHVVLEFHGQRLNIFNTQGIWGLDGEDTQRRLKMAGTIVDNIKGLDNVILAGDFNVQAGTKTIGLIEKHLTNVFAGELLSSFNMAHKPKDSGYATAVVDMVFVSPSLTIVEHRCPRVDVSDHLPLVVTLEIN